MRDWTVHGVHRDSGHSRVFFIRANDEESACRFAAEHGYVSERVEAEEPPKRRLAYGLASATLIIVLAAYIVLWLGRMSVATPGDSQRASVTPGAPDPVARTELTPGEVAELERIRRQSALRRAADGGRLYQLGDRIARGLRLTETSVSRGREGEEGVNWRVRFSTYNERSDESCLYDIRLVLLSSDGWPVGASDWTYTAFSPGLDREYDDIYLRRGVDDVASALVVLKRNWLSDCK